MSAFDKIPLCLRELEQWVVWKNFPNSDGTNRKMLFSATDGCAGSSTNPHTWTTFDNAVAAANRYSGIGFVFTAEDDFVGIDLDGCRNPDTGKFAPWAHDIIERLDSYTEVSPSMTGAKIWVHGKSPFDRGRHIKLTTVEKVSEKNPGIEAYERGRYFACTGLRIDGVSPEVEYRQDELEAVLGEWMPDKSRTVHQHTNNGVASIDNSTVVGRARKYLSVMPGAVSGSGGHNTTYHTACVLVCGFGLGEREALALLVEWNHKCEPPWTESELLHKVRDAAKADGPRNYLRDSKPESWGSVKVPKYQQQSNDADGEGDDNKKSKSVATVLIDMVRNDDRYELFHTDGGDDDAPTFVSITNENGGRRTVAIRSSQFRTEISRAYFRLTGKVAAKVAVDDALSTIEGVARFDGPAYPVGLRLAGYENTIYFDLGNDSWRVVKIDREGWTIIDSVDCPVRFYRKRGMLPVPDPVHGGNMNDLRGVLNLPDDDSWLLIAGWIIAAMNPTGPYPVLVMNGEEGCGKTDGCRFIRNLIDPNKAGLRRPPRNDDDLSIAANNSRVIAFDNLSGLRRGLSDLLCGIATGTGFGKRQLYSDDGEIIINICRPIMLNGIDELTTRGDLASRSFLLRLNPIGDENRRDESELKTQYEKIRPGVLGAIFDAVACALRCRDSVHFDRLPRLADVAKWVEAASGALGWKRGAFLGAVMRNREAMDTAAVELSPIGPAIIRIVDAHGGQYAATAGGWFDELSRVDYADRPKAWPQGATGTANAIRRLAPKLRGCGYAVDIHEPKNHHERTTFEIIKMENDIPDIPDIPRYSDALHGNADSEPESTIGVGGVGGVCSVQNPDIDSGEPQPIKVWEAIDE